MKNQHLFYKLATPVAIYNSIYGISEISLLCYIITGDKLD